ncbi:helix-turn-helix transcriptional regulator [Paraglaciecola arctica]|uniref:HTH araC/xylS-type domain-containing protein n=1 Tax=Paraglaciecola arctica BSs20135 TaxID=493475 RepID=K6XBD9_9ALTE|nr:AraC family transcriptional regulator [Paraglaciecola arctica]GAC17934.1 hypothetical protein GARC_0953 [Paraglaciecola arctica BSs20135]
MLYCLDSFSIGQSKLVPDSFFLSHQPPQAIHDHGLAMLTSILAAAGLSLPVVLADLGLKDNGRLSIVDFLRILESFSVELRDESLHMSKRPLLPGTNDHVLANLSRSDTLLDALQQLASSYNFIHGGAYNRVEVKDREVIYVIDDRDFPYLDDSSSEHIRFNLECVLLYVHGVICSLSHPRQVDLKKLQSRASSQKYSLFLAAFPNLPIRYNASCYALHYPVELAKVKLRREQHIHLTSARVYSELKQYLLVEPDSHENFLNKVRTALKAGLYSQEAVADRLGCSVATLRRKLADCNSSFRKARERVLNQEAKMLLSQHMNLDDIAHKLGFSDARSFNRAFKAWNGMTPRDFVDNH